LWRSDSAPMWRSSHCSASRVALSDAPARRPSEGQQTCRNGQPATRPPASDASDASNAERRGSWSFATDFNCHTGRAVQGQSKLSKHGIDLVIRHAAPPSEANRPGDVRQGHRTTPERTSATIEESATVGDTLWHEVQSRCTRHSSRVAGSGEMFCTESRRVNSFSGAPGVTKCLQDVD